MNDRNHLVLSWEEIAREEAAKVVLLREALCKYADPRHWGISRDDFDHPVVAWIGPGALSKRGLPDPMEVAREALESVTRPQTEEGT